MMSSLTAAWIVVPIAIVLIWIIWNDKRKWKTVYEVSGGQSDEIQVRYNYLKRQGIQCRVKSFTPSNVKSIGTQSKQIPKQSTTHLQVNKKETDRAYKHLADFNNIR
ncbi:hypothetical protein JNUCC1_01629 [Lentibacillus sp. JNUCC-1]|uniref:hypothetical protein n=1 Tax=Lentibacillus sp. JNUCC-1 TaxID=2654513 RepID=UPI0012E80E36|nr:hypothetical protein [Lentibacillus sp. JNUCC-1]MUV37823.1 hypothetical protein [Lentibacillus sp. JNUCC-1]